ncbi:MAG: tetratricopeptide repeat protein [bacterium]|nr:tetratricopeptide repeat protein [bacterium]
MAAKLKVEKIAPGLVRMPHPAFRNEKGRLDGIPVTLTLNDEADDMAVGIITPSARTPWGCLFFTLLALCILLAIWSARFASLFSLVCLIVFYSLFNQPSRRKAEEVRRSLLMINNRQAKRARSSLRGPLRRLPDDEGLNYLAALVEIIDGNYAQALTHLTFSAPDMDRFAEYHHMLGRCHANLGDKPAAELAYKQALAFTHYPSWTILQRESEMLNLPTEVSDA